MKRAVVAVGGNALSTDVEKQEEEFRQVAKALMPLIAEGSEVILVHGNGPQVGVIHEAFDLAHRLEGSPAVPYQGCTAMNIGSIGYNYERAIVNEMRAEGVKERPVATIVTRVVADPEDPAFSNPLKPVGVFYDEQTARELEKKTGRPYIEDSGRGWRRAVPSPETKHVIEADIIAGLAREGVIVIGGGGAGVPVVEKNGACEAVEAVCDKDITAARLADLIDADLLLLLTAVDNIAVNFGTPEQKNLTDVTSAEMEQYIQEGQFPAGSMLPKVQACVDFVQGGHGRVAVVANLDKAAAAYAEKTGTIIRK